jgi:hypothetical protein
MQCTAWLSHHRRGSHCFHARETRAGHNSKSSIKQQHATIVLHSLLTIEGVASPFVWRPQHRGALRKARDSPGHQRKRAPADKAVKHGEVPLVTFCAIAVLHSTPYATTDSAADVPTRHIADGNSRCVAHRGTAGLVSWWRCIRLAGKLQCKLTRFAQPSSPVHGWLLTPGVPSTCTKECNMRRTVQGIIRFVVCGAETQGMGGTDPAAF